MKFLRKQLLIPILTFIALGASMPYLASQMQDAKISGFRKKIELNTVNLTLRQEGNVWGVLPLMSKEYRESPWKGETVLTEMEANRAVLVSLEEIERYDLLPEGISGQWMKTEGSTQPYLLVAADGSSALVWVHTVDCDEGILIVTVDDTTRKIVRLLVNQFTSSVGLSKDEAHFQMEKWNDFLQNYYNIELVDAKEKYIYIKNGGLSSLFDLRFSSKDGTELCDFNLSITDSYISFNHK